MSIEKKFRADVERALTEGDASWAVLDRCALAVMNYHRANSDLPAVDHARDLSDEELDRYVQVRAEAAVVLRALGLMELLSVLRSVEWTYDGNAPGAATFCPSCGVHRGDCRCGDCDHDHESDSHAEGCALAAAIAKAEGRS